MNDESTGPAPAPGPARSSRFRTGARPAVRRLGLLALIAGGGAAGTSVRAVLEAAAGTEPPAWPWATFAVNVSGALVLGFLLEVLARAGPDSGWRRRVRLAAGTGFLGGYTTYSTFAVEVVQLSQQAPHLARAAYAAASVALGPVAAAAGYLLGRRLRTPRAIRRPA